MKNSGTFTPRSTFMCNFVSKLKFLKVYDTFWGFKHKLLKIDACFLKLYFEFKIFFYTHIDFKRVKNKIF